MEFLASLGYMNGKTRTPHGVQCLIALFVALAAHAITPTVCAQESIAQLDAAQTKVEFSLGDVLHKVHGTFKLKSGEIQFDPSTGKASGAIVVDARSGDSGSNGRDHKMHRDILQSDKFPEIIFIPGQVKGALAPQGPSRMEVSGQFQIHGEAHDVTLPVDVEADGRQLRLTAQFTVPYVKWGLKNPSTFILRVSDTVTIDIHAVAHLVSQ
jgi:polyisoprenoid-binding protein YceI